MSKENESYVLIMVKIRVDEGSKASDLPSETWADTCLSLDRAKQALISLSYLLRTKYGSCPLFKSCHDATRICSSILSRVSNTLKNMIGFEEMVINV